MKRAIVTGGTGFIGGWLIDELLQNDYEVTAIVRNSNKIHTIIRDNLNLRVIEKSINELTKTDYSDEHYDCFFHLAWDGVSTEKKNDISLQLENIKMVIDALEIANDIKCNKFIASGTVAEYVFCDSIMDVNAKQSPNDMYGAAKVSAHYFLEVRARQLSQQYNWVVIPSTYGERRVDNNIITYTITSLLQGNKPIFGNLQQMWDFLYVSDVVRAIRLIAEKGNPDSVYGIGSGVYKPLKSYIEEIRDLINPKLQLGIGELSDMSTKTFSSCVNIDDLKRDTGFKPTVAFEEGIKRTIEYLRSTLK